MRRILHILAALAPASLGAAEAPAIAPPKKISAISLLPDGSQLHQVMFPRYDKNQRLVGTLKAKAMTLVNKETIAGDQVEVEFYNPDQTPRGRVDLSKAVFNQKNGTLTAVEPVKLHSDRINAGGEGLIYSFEQGEGFLTGPAITWMQAPTETAMKPSLPSLKATAVIGATLAAQPLAANPPQIPAAQADTASHTAEIRETADTARKNLRADLEASEAATRAAKAFLERADLISKSNASEAPVAASDAKPLDVSPGPTDTVIQCDGGMYFNADEGLFVYLKNVRVNDPRFTLTGANELKIRLSKKPEPAPGKPSDATKSSKPALGMGAKFGEVESITATGAVKITQKETAQGKQPVQASGAIFTYHPATGDITLSGGYPWVMQGTTYMRAKEPNLILRIQKSGSFITEGNWEMGGNLEKEKAAKQPR